MGYYSDLSGEVTFSRSLTVKEAKKVKEAQDSVWGYYELIQEAETREVDEGTLTVTRTTGLRLLEEVQSQCKAYEWKNMLRAMIEALPEDVTTSGYFERIGEESPDMERLYVIGRRVVSVKPEIVWPEPE